MESRAITLEIGEDIDQQLERLARETGQDKRDIARNAIIEWLEDVEDARDAIAILEQNEPSRSIQDVRKGLGMDLEFLRSPEISIRES
jgi:predicted DNA-binding protein